MPTIQRDIRYLTTEELTHLRRRDEAKAYLAIQKGNAGAVRARVLLDTLRTSGLRASEVASLQVQHCLLVFG